eukprot:scaffold260375_cov27-Tisochrysis_lutea.AAC.4
MTDEWVAQHAQSREPDGPRRKLPARPGTRLALIRASAGRGEANGRGKRVRATHHEARGSCPRKRWKGLKISGLWGRVPDFSASACGSMDAGASGPSRADHRARGNAGRRIVHVQVLPRRCLMRAPSERLGLRQHKFDLVVAGPPSGGMAAVREQHLVHMDMRRHTRLGEVEGYRDGHARLNSLADELPPLKRPRCAQKRFSHAQIVRHDAEGDSAKGCDFSGRRAHLLASSPRRRTQRLPLHTLEELADVHAESLASLLGVDTVAHPEH